MKKKIAFIPLSIIIFICLGTVYSWSIFKKPLEELYNINSAQSNLPYMFFLLSYALLMPITGQHVEKFGPRLTMIFGGLLTGVGWILSGMVSNIYLMTLTYGLIAGAGVGIVYGVPITVVSKWFPKNKGVIMGIILGGFGLSPFVTAPIAGYFIRTYDPMLTFKILGFAFLVLITICSLPFTFPTEKIEEDRFKLNVFKVSTLFKRKQFWGLWSCYVIGTLIGLMMIGITSPVGEELYGLSTQQTALMISIFALFNALGRPLFGWITDRFTPLYAAIVSFILILLAGFIIVLSVKSTIGYVIAFSIFWLNLGGWLAIAPTATASIFDLKHYSRIYGIIFTAYGVGALMGGTLSGLIKQIMGSYYYVFYPVIGLAATGIVLSILLLRNKPVCEK